MIKEGYRPDHGGQRMLENILESLPEVFSGEPEPGAACHFYPVNA
jgi:hypothetical protein